MGRRLPGRRSCRGDERQNCSRDRCRSGGSRDRAGAARPRLSRVDLRRGPTAGNHLESRGSAVVAGDDDSAPEPHRSVRCAAHEGIGACLPDLSRPRRGRLRHSLDRELLDRRRSELERPREPAVVRFGSMLPRRASVPQARRTSFSGKICDPFCDDADRSTHLSCGGISRRAAARCGVQRAFVRCDRADHGAAGSARLQLHGAWGEGIVRR